MDKLKYCNDNTITIKKDHSFEKDMVELFHTHKTTGKRQKAAILEKIEVTQEGTFEASLKINTKDKIREFCALNFASATKPGGGVKNGRTAQEETLSRQLSLYFSLIKDKEMYKYHKENTNSFYTHYMIYSPNVVVF